MRTRTRRLRAVLIVAGVLFVSSSSAACSGPCVVVPGVAQYCAGPAT